MSRSIFTGLIFTALFGCSQKVVTSTASNQTPESNLSVKATTQTIDIRLQAINLSEDFSVVSSKNDEILLMIYPYLEKSELALLPPLLSKKMLFDGTKKQSSLQLETADLTGENKVFVLLIEQDSETPLEQIDPVIRVHYQTIIDSYRSRDYKELERYLGDEDLLGIAITTYDQLRKGRTFDFKGVHKMDKYHYLLSVEKR